MLISSSEFKAWHARQIIIIINPLQTLYKE